MKWLFLQAIIFILFFSSTHCFLGVQTSPVITVPSTFECIKAAGYNYSIVRAFTVEGVDLDLAVKDTLIYSKRAGLQTDLFLRPCRGKSATFQITTIMLVIAEQYYDKLWLFLQENPNVGCTWPTDHAANCKYMKEMLSQIKYFQKPAGIYISPSFFGRYFGGASSCPELSQYDLIYPHNDSIDSFNDFVPFGGWTIPTKKAYQLNATQCGLNINKLYSERV